MGGVLVDLDIEGCKTAFKRILDYQKIDEIIDPCHQKGIWGDLEEGVLSADDFRKIVLSGSRPGAVPQEVALLDVRHVDHVQMDKETYLEHKI